MLYTKMRTERYEKKEGTKTVYELFNTELSEINKEQYKNIIEAAPFFRKLGGSEHLQYSHTKKGYLCTKLISTSPDKKRKNIRYFDFDIKEDIKE